MAFKRLAIIFSACALLIVFAALLSNNKSWGATSEIYYSVGKNLEAKVDILNGDYKSVDDQNLFYNGQKVYISIEWRATENISKTAGLALELPVNRDEKQVGFESPVFKNVDLSSDDAKVITKLNKTGAKISSSFIASEQSPIQKGAKGAILVPHNIFAQAGAPEQKIQMILTGDGGEKYSITKNVKSVPEGLSAYDFRLYDRTGQTETTSFESMKSVQTQLGFSYKSGSFGINEGDALLIRLGAEGAARLTPYATESVDVKDSAGTTVGFLKFYDNVAEDGASYIRLEFNGAFKKNAGAAYINGNVRFMQYLNFDRRGTFTIAISANKSRASLNVTASELSVSERRFNSGSKKYISVNESDILNAVSETKDEFVLKENSGGYVDRDSIRIVKILTKSQRSDMSAYGFDAQTLKPSSIGVEDYVGYDKNIFESRRGLTVTEFEKYANKTNAIKFLTDEQNNATGFELKLGKLNEPKGNGEYAIMYYDGETRRVPKDSKPFGYLIYYNEIPIESKIIPENIPEEANREIGKEIGKEIGEEIGEEIDEEIGIIIEEPPDPTDANLNVVAETLPAPSEFSIEEIEEIAESSKENPVTGDLTSYWKMVLAASVIFTAFNARVYYSKKNKALKNRRVYVNKARKRT
jgi:hypothetical protein